jgi:hypothetical protein
MSCAWASTHTSIHPTRLESLRAGSQKPDNYSTRTLRVLSVLRLVAAFELLLIPAARKASDCVSMLNLQWPVNFTKSCLLFSVGLASELAYSSSTTRKPDVSLFGGDS